MQQSNFLVDYFEHKKDLINLVDALNLSPNSYGAISLYSQTLAIMTLRFMIAWKYDFDGKIFGFTDPDDQNFYRVYLSYLA